MKPIRVTLKPGKDSPIRALHPWIFSGAIEKIDGDVAPGASAEVFSSKGDRLGVGLYSPGSIAVKMLAVSASPLSVDEVLRRRFNDAVAYRARLGLFDDTRTNAFRLVNGEGDFLPGIVADLYQTTLVLEFHSIGMHLRRSLIAEVLRDALASRITTIYARLDESLKKYGSEEFLLGGESSVIVMESGLSYEVDVVNGQKTGFFLDQRENRDLVGKMAAGRSVLNTFCYTGGFSVAALAGGASRVVSVDSSQRACDLVARNADLNLPFVGTHEVLTRDCFDYLAGIRDEFDLIVLDPPAFAKRRSSLKNALRGYRTINLKAMKAIRNHGLLFSFSCSQIVSQPQFLEVVQSAASEAGRDARIVSFLGQAPCHPSSICHPEGRYLKGVILEIS